MSKKLCRPKKDGPEEIYGLGFYNYAAAKLTTLQHKEHNTKTSYYLSYSRNQSSTKI
jgi:hypothetical protein